MACLVVPRISSGYGAGFTQQHRQQQMHKHLSTRLHASQAGILAPHLQQAQENNCMPDHPDITMICSHALRPDSGFSFACQPAACTGLRFSQAPYTCVLPCGDNSWV